MLCRHARDGHLPLQPERWPLVTGLGAFMRENALWLGAGVLLTLLSSFGQTFFISIFAAEIRAEFSLSHGGWGALYAAATTGSAAVMVFAGTLSDHLRVRVLGPLMIVGLALACVAMAVAQGIWALAGAVFALRLFGQGMLSHTAMVAMARWFVATRGRAVSIAALGFSLGEAVLPLSFVLILSPGNWRGLWLGVALGLVLLAPLLFVVLRHERTPQSMAREVGAAGMGGRMWTRRQALRDPLLWLMMPALMGPPAWNTAFFFHQVNLAAVKGWSHATLVALFPVFTLSAVSFGLIAGWLVDRFGSARLMPVYLLGFAAGYAVFAPAATPVEGAVAVAFMGGSAGAAGTLNGTLWAEAYGTRHIGAIRSMLAAVMVLGSAIGPGVSGAIIDMGVDYARQGWGVAVYFIAAAGLAGLGARRLGAARAPI